jgi:N-glycosidase YbiA
MPQITSFSGDYAFLSNFYPAATPYEGVVYPSSEHAFQAAKTLDMEERHRLASLSTPGKAKRAGRRVALRRDWEQIKIAIMTAIVRAKFQHNEELAQKLAATADAELVEGNQHRDRFWGVCKGEGQNWLGRILMAVRAEFANSLGTST